MDLPRPPDIDVPKDQFVVHNTLQNYGVVAFSVVEIRLVKMWGYDRHMCAIYSPSALGKAPPVSEAVYYISQVVSCRNFYQIWLQDLENG